MVHNSSFLHSIKQFALSQVGQGNRGNHLHANTDRGTVAIATPAYAAFDLNCQRDCRHGTRRQGSASHHVTCARAVRKHVFGNFLANSSRALSAARKTAPSRHCASARPHTRAHGRSSGTPTRRRSPASCRAREAAKGRAPIWCWGSDSASSASCAESSHAVFAAESNSILDYPPRSCTHAPPTVRAALLPSSREFSLAREFEKKKDGKKVKVSLRDHLSR